MQSFSHFLRASARPSLMFNPLLVRPALMPFNFYDFQQRGVRLQLRINRQLRKYRQEKAKKEK